VSGRVLYLRVAAILMGKGFRMTQEEIERETIRQMLIGSLALELPPKAFVVLMSIYAKNQQKKRAA
jgi:hypothetical protein